MWIVLGLLFLCSGIIYCYRELKYIKMNNDIYIISYARLLYSCSCGFFGAILCFLYAFQGIKLRLSTLVIMDYDNEAAINLLIFWLCGVIGYCSLCAGYSIVRNKKIVISRNSAIHRKVLSDRQVYIIAVMCFLIGLFGLIIWTSDMGGISQYIILASAIRGDYYNVYGNTHMAFRQIAKILLPATYMFFFLSIQHEKTKLLYRISFIVSLIFSVLYLLCNDGRLTTAMFFLILVVGKMRYGKNEGKDIKKQFIKLGILLLFAFILLAKLDDISYFIRNNSVKIKSPSEEYSIFETLMQEFTYIYKSGITAVANCFPNGRLLFIDDLLFGISAYIPGNLGDYTHISLYNTILCTHNTVNMAGAIPCDLIAYSLYALSYAGVIIIPMIVGMTVRFVENSFQGKKNNPLEQTLYAGAQLTAFRLMTYCEVYDFLTAIFAYLFLWLLAYLMSFIFRCRIGGMRK